MAAAFSLKIEGQHRVEKRMHDLAAAFGDLGPLMGRFGLYLEESTIDRFNSETAPDGSKWEPSLRAQNEGGKTLTDTARLKQSITHNAGSDRVEVGTNVVYGGVHQDGIDKAVTVKAHKRTITQAFGRSLPGGLEVNVGSFERQMKMPARPYLGLSNDDEDELLALAEEYVLEIAPEAGR